MIIDIIFKDQLLQYSKLSNSHSSRMYLRIIAVLNDLLFYIPQHLGRLFLYSISMNYHFAK